MKTIVIYKSKTNFSKRYAEWIAEELSADIFSVSKISIERVKEYDIIIFGGSLHAVGINGIKFITKNFKEFQNKKVIIFATGASPMKETILNEIENNNFTKEQQKYIKLFYLRGGFDYNKLNFCDKFLMTLLKWKLKSKKELTPDEKGMLLAYNNPVDFMTKENIQQLIRYVKYINKDIN